MIAPHTTTPTASAAIHDPCQRETVSLACVVIGERSPRFSTVVALQPAVIVTSTTARAAVGSRRRGNLGRDRRDMPRDSSVPADSRRPVPISPWAPCLRALRLGLTDGLPSNKSRRQRPVEFDVLQLVVETVQRQGAASWGTPASRRALAAQKFVITPA